MKNGTLAIIQKDLRGLLANRRMLIALLVVPLILTVLIPTIFVMSIHFLPDEADDFQKLLQLLPYAEQSGDFERTVVGLVFNYILPVFFLLIPIMAATIMAATSFVGEREKHTLETLLYCPMPLCQIFRSKVLAAFSLSMAVSLASFAAMLLVFEGELLLLGGSLLAPDVKWLLIMLLVSPAVSLIAITMIVRFSARAQSVEEAQQSAVFLILPILLLIVGQFTGVLLISTWLLLGLGCLCALLAWFLLKRALGSFTYEQLLK